jgi:hypothetical protein
MKSRKPLARAKMRRSGPSIRSRGETVIFWKKGARMENLLQWIGRLGGIVGVAITLIAVVARLQGSYMLGGFQVGTLLLAGIGGMVVGCLGYAAALAERPR